MTIQVHYFEIRDGVNVCKNCGLVKNADRVGPQWCSGVLPQIDTREIDDLRVDRDEWRQQHENLLVIYQKQLEVTDQIRRECDEFKRKLDLIAGICARGSRFTDRHMEAAADSIIQEILAVLPKNCS